MTLTRRELLRAAAGGLLTRGALPALGLSLGGLTGLFAFGGVFLNANFVLAGALGPNPVLIVLGTLLVLAWRNAGWVGLDRWLLPAGSRLLGRREAARPERSRAGDRRWR